MYLTFTKTPMILAALISTNTVFADSWTITQNVTVRNALTLSHINGNHSKQIVNAIHLDENTASVADIKQTFGMGSNDLRLLLNGSESSLQAINFLNAPAIATATQTATDLGSVMIFQQGGNNNIQALNVAKTTGATNTAQQALTQTVEAEQITFKFQGVGSGNTQAGNYIEAGAVDSASGDITQHFTVATLNFIQSGSNNLQAGNVVIKGGTSQSAVTQSFTAGKVNANYVSVGPDSRSVIAANYFADNL